MKKIKINNKLINISNNNYKFKNNSYALILVKK